MNRFKNSYCNTNSIKTLWELTQFPRQFYKTHLFSLRIDSARTCSRASRERQLKRRLTMMEQSRAGFLLGALLLVLMAVGIKPIFAAQPSGVGNISKMDQILERLERIEANMDAPSTSATFCISQGRGLELGADWAGELKWEGEIGAGWAEVGDVKITAAPSLPVVLKAGRFPLFVPIPLPTEVSIGVQGGLGRIMDICIDVPITLSPEDEARLAAIAIDINAKTGDGVLEKGKFQRRAGRILNYAALRVPGNQRSLLAAANNSSVSATDADAEIEFDRADNAIANLLDNGLGQATEGLDVFKDTNIKELLATLEVPVGVKSFMDDPELHLFDSLPDLSGGIRNLTCLDLGVTAEMRSRSVNNRRGRLNSLCDRLENLPSFDRAIQAAELGSEIAEDIVDGISEVMANTIDGVSDTRADAKARFCGSTVGLRRAFNRYCGR